MFHPYSETPKSCTIYCCASENVYNVYLQTYTKVLNFRTGGRYCLLWVSRDGRLTESWGESGSCGRQVEEYIMVSEEAYTVRMKNTFVWS